MGGRRITEAEIERANELRAEGLSLTKIGKALGRSRSGMERLFSNPYSEGRACSSCSAPITNYAKSGVCLPCTTARRNRDPEFSAKRAAGRARALREDPVKYARACQIARDNIRRAMADPEIRARFVEAGKQRAADYFTTPEGRERCMNPAARRKASLKLVEFRLGWCPVEYRDDYKRLVQSKNCTAAEGRKIIEDQIAADKKREEQKLTPFERQLRALEKGAQLIANDQKPSLANPGVYGERVA